MASTGSGGSAARYSDLLADSPDVDIVAINDIAPNNALAYLLKYDTVMGRFKGELKLEGDKLSPVVRYRC